MNDRTAIFTICSNNYLAQAGVFFETARAHHPEAALFLGLADEPADIVYPPGVTLLPARDLAIPDFASVAFGYDIMEFNTAIKPFVFLSLRERGFARVLYFDPDIMIFRRLDDVLGLLDGGASFALTPHLLAPPGPGAPRTERDVMRTGTFNLGFLGVSAHPETGTVLRWWARKLRHECVNDQTGGLFVDQKFMDLVPGFAPAACVLRDPTLNVAYWNVAQRKVARAGAGWTVDGRPLGFFHFSGFDPRRPAVLSKHTPTAVVPEALAALLLLYAGRLDAAANGVPAPPYAFGTFASGTPIPDALRRMFRETRPAWAGDPFETFEAHAAMPCVEAAVGAGGEVVNLYAGYLHGKSPELRCRFDLGHREGAAAFHRWFRDDARRDGVSGVLVHADPPPTGPGTSPGEHAAKRGAREEMMDETVPRPSVGSQSRDDARSLTEFGLDLDDLRFEVGRLRAALGEAQSEARAYAEQNARLRHENAALNAILDRVRRSAVWRLARPLVHYARSLRGAP